MSKGMIELSLVYGEVRHDALVKSTQNESILFFTLHDATKLNKLGISKINKATSIFS